MAVATKRFWTHPAAQVALPLLHTPHFPRSPSRQQKTQKRWLAPSGLFVLASRRATSAIEPYSQPVRHSPLATWRKHISYLLLQASDLSCLIIICYFGCGTFKKQKQQQWKEIIRQDTHLHCICLCCCIYVAFGGIDTKAPHDIFTAANMAQTKTHRAINWCTRCCCHSFNSVYTYTHRHIHVRWCRCCFCGIFGFSCLLICLCFSNTCCILFAVNTRPCTYMYVCMCVCIFNL